MVHQWCLLTSIQILLHDLLLRALVRRAKALRLQCRTTREVTSSIDGLLKRVAFPTENIVGVMTVAGSGRLGQSFGQRMGKRATQEAHMHARTTAETLTRHPGSTQTADFHRSASLRRENYRYPKPSRGKSEGFGRDDWKGRSCCRHNHHTRRGFRGPRCRGSCHPSICRMMMKSAICF